MGATTQHKHVQCRRHRETIFRPRILKAGDFVGEWVSSNAGDAYHDVRTYGSLTVADL